MKRKVFSTISILALVGVFLFAGMAKADPFEGRPHDWTNKHTFRKAVTFKGPVTVEGTLSSSQYAKEFYVDSGSGHDVPTDGLTWEKPFATVEYALQQCTASRGDIIHLLPGHAESTTTTAIWDLDIAGVTIVGHGEGDLRPTITHGAAAAYVDVAADDITLYNILFVAGVNTGTAAMVYVEADDCWIDNCEFRNISSSLHTDYFIQTSATSNAADRLTVSNSRFYAVSADADCNAAIDIPGVQDSVLIQDNLIVGTYDDAGIHNPTGKVCTNMQIIGNVVENTQAGDHAIELVSNCTGNMVDNRFYTNAFATCLSPGYLKCTGNLFVDAVAEGGTPIPAKGDSTDNYIGTNSGNNDADTSSVAANAAGSILERLEQIQEAVNQDAGQALPANKSLFDIIGETYTDDGGGDHLDDVYAHLNTISKYVADGDGDFAAGTALASNKSLVDALGQNGADTTQTGDRDAAAIQERIDAIALSMGIVDAAGTNGFEEDGTGGDLYDVFNSSDANANYFSMDAGTDKGDNVYSYFAYLDGLVNDAMAKLGMTGDTIGDVYYVDDATGDDADNGTTWALAEATLDAAIGDCTADKGDIIFVAPDHEESIGAAQIAADIAGIKIIGLGSGEQQPMITMTDAASSVDVTGTDITIENIRFYSTTADSTICIDVDASGFVLRGCRFDGNAAGHVIGVDLATTLSDIVIEDNFVYDTDTDCTSFLTSAAGACTNVKILNNQIWGDYDDAAINSSVADVNWLVKGNTIRNVQTGDHAIQFASTTTGYILNNILAADTPGAILDPGSCMYADNEIVDTDILDANDRGMKVDKWYYATKTFELDATATYDALFTVTGACELKVYGICTETLTANADTISIGPSDDPALIIAATAGNAPISNGDVWTSTTPAKGEPSLATSFIVNGDTVGITQSGANLADGTVVIHVYWRPLSAGASVVPT